MATSDITSVPMTTIEENRLAELENVVESGLDTFVKVGTALAEIRDSKLYRQTHADFADYLADRWQISESRGYQLIAAARVSTIVETAGLPAPTNEAQTRPLTGSGLNDVTVQQAWQAACVASAGRPTARDVQNARNEIRPTPVRLTTTPKRHPLPDDYRRAITDLDKVTRRLAELHRDDRFGSNRVGMNHFLPLLTEIAGRVNDAAAQLAGIEQATLDTSLAPVVDTGHRRAPGRRGSSRQHFVITSNGNTARVADTRTLRDVLELVDVPSQRDPKSSFYRCFQATMLADVCAALEADGHSVQLDEVGQ